jgi:hypothetical protein
VGACVAGVCARGATSPLDGVTVGLDGVQTDCEGVLGRNSLALGTGPIDSSSLVAQSIRACLRGAGLTGVLAVVDGARSRTSPWISFIASCSPVLASRRSFTRSLAPSSFSTLFPFSSLLCCLSSSSPSVLLSFTSLSGGFVLRCSSPVCVTSAAASLLGSVEGVGVSAGVATGAVETEAAGMVVVVVVEVVVVVAAYAGACEASASRITNAARKFAIALRIPSGNGPDRFIFHSNSMRRSLASHCATVLSDMASGCGCVVRAVCANRAQSRLRAKWVVQAR